MEWLDRLRTRLSVPVDGAGLAWFRLAFGLVVFWEMCRYYEADRISEYWIEPSVTFPYWPFYFVRALPEPWMVYTHVAVVAIAALCVAVGYRYRIATVVLFVGFTWLFLIDQTRYLNHFYLVSLLSFILMWLPANRVFSLDAWSGRVAATDQVPTWSLWWVRFMLGVPYFYGGVAKITEDWITGRRMKLRLDGSDDHPLVGWFHDTDLALSLFVWGGLLFDLLVVPLLLWPRTRVVALAFATLFHLSNAHMFTIGIFPWFMIAATLVFLPSDWPRRILADLREAKPAGFGFASGALVGFMAASHFSKDPSAVEAVIGAIGVGVLAWEVCRYGWDWRRSETLGAPAPETSEAPPAGSTVAPLGRPAMACLAAFVAIQLFLPLRHLLIPGDVNWTEQGHRWSWHMLLRSKGMEKMTMIVDPPGRTPPFAVDPKNHLKKHQIRKVAGSPEMNIQLAHHLVETLHVPGAAVYVDSLIVLNGRPPARMIDQHQDLTKVTVPWLAPAPWMLPLPELDASPGAIAGRQEE